MVSGTNGKGCAQDENDRGARAEVADRILAHGDGRRDSGRRHAATSGVNYPVREIAKEICPSTSSRADTTSCRRRSEVVVNPAQGLAITPSEEWAHQLGASPSKRMTASWSGPRRGPTDYKVAVRVIAPNGRLPSVQRMISGGSHEHLDIESPIQGLVIDAAEIRYGLEVGLQMAEQPDHLDIAVGFGFQAAAGAG